MAATVSSVLSLGQIGTTTGLTAGDRRPIMGYTVVLSASDANGGDIALASGSIPQDGDSYGSGGLVVVRRTARRSGRITQQWDVEVEYGVDSTVSGSNVAPWQRDDLYSYGSVAYTVPMELDYTPDTPKHVVNYAGLPFNPPLMTTRRNMLVKVRRARKWTDFDPYAANLLIDSLNSTTFTIDGNIVAAKKARLVDCDVQEDIWKDATGYYNIVITVEIETGYPLEEIEVASMGLDELKTASTLSSKTIPIVGADGQRVREPVYIGTDGKAYWGAPPYPTVTFKQYRVESWAALWT